MGKASDNIKTISLYASKAITANGVTPSFYTNWLGNTVLENQVIAYWKQKGITSAYLSSGNQTAGFLAPQYATTIKNNLKSFIQNCTNNGIDIGMVIGLSTSTTAPAQRVVDYNSGATAGQKLKAVLIEEEYWNPGNMTFAQYKAAVQIVYNLLHPTGVSVDAYLVRDNPGEFAQLAPYLDIFWMTQYTNQPRYDGIHSWVAELAATTPVTPIKVGALVSVESYYYNKTGGISSNNNFDGYWVEGRKISAPFTNPQPIVTSPKNLNQLADKITHNGTVGLPPIDFNSEPTSVTNYIDWQGIMVFDWDIYPHLSNLDANTNQVWAFGDGSVNDAINYPVAQQVAGLVPYNAARFLYLGDVYDTGTQAEYIGSTRSYDTLYGTQSNHNLLILTSSTPGNHEWANRSVGYDPYWSGSLAGVGSVQPVWDGDRTITNPHYYSFFIGNWKFICINSMEDGIASGGVVSGSPMYNWLVNELNDPTGDKRKIVFCHHPRWSDDTQHGDNSAMQPVWAAMQGKALILLTGHVHNYQRHNMRDASGNVVTGGGVYQVVSGTGGQSPYSFTGSYLSGAIAYKTLQHGATRLTLYDDHIDVCFVQYDGAVLDCASIPVASVIPPVVDAGPDQSITLPSTATMAGTATDINSPVLPLVNIWTKTSGPGTVIFSNQNSLTAVATFSLPGTYVLRLTSNNGSASAYDEMTVTVGSVATKILTVNSTPNTGVTITSDTADLFGVSSGSTSFTLEYGTATFPTLTAPSTAGVGLNFQRWLVDGVPMSYSTSLIITDTISRTYTAVYGTPTPDAVWRVFVNSNVAATVASAYAKVIPEDISGQIVQNVFFELDRPLYYFDGTSVTITSSGSQVGAVFLYWLKDGLPFVGNTNVVQTFTITADTELTVVYDVSALNTFETTQTTVDPLCPGDDGTLTITPVDAETYTYLWNTGDTTNTITTPLLGDVIGNYTYNLFTCLVTVTTGTFAGATQTYTIVIYGKIPITATFSEGVYACGDTSSSIQANPSGGQQPYTYLWSTGETTRSVTKPFGTYDVTITDANGCVSDPQSVTTNAPSPISINELTVQDPTCSGGENGIVVLQISGGVYPYLADVTIGGNPVPSAVVGNQVTANNLGAGTYDFLITDGIGCTATHSTALTDPTAISVVVVVVDVTCNGASDGIATFTPSNGLAPYTYYVDGNPAAHVTTDLAPGDHIYYIVDANGCSATGTFTVTEPTPLTSSVDKTDVTCNGADNGTATVTANGGTTPYQYSLNGGAYGSSPTFSGIGTGVYSIYTKDAHNCVSVVSFDISEPSPIILSATITNPSGVGTPDGSILLSVTGGVYPIDGLWDDGTTFTLSAQGQYLYDTLIAGIYGVTVTDSNACMRTGSYTLSNPTPVPPVPTNPDADIDTLLPIFNCCLANKIYSVMKGYANGHAQLDCVAIPVMMLDQKIKLLSSYYTAGQTIGGSKGEFVFRVPEFDNYQYTLNLIGFDEVIYSGDSLLTYDENMTLFIAALNAAGWDAEYDSGMVFIYSPMNCYYNGIFVSVVVNYVVGPPDPVKAAIISKNGIMGASNPCVTDNVLNCITEQQKIDLIEEIRVACQTCLCGTATKDID